LYSLQPADAWSQLIELAKTAINQQRFDLATESCRVMHKLRG